MHSICYIPYHDWRKIISEGNRTRDSHFIESFREIPEVDNLIIINRPITWAELILRKKLTSLRLDGEVVFRYKGCSLIKLDKKTYLLDFCLNQNLSNIFSGRSWYFSAYKSQIVLDFVKKSFQTIGISEVHVISANIFSSGLVEQVEARRKVFDAWDNFVLFPGLKGIRNELANSYLEYSKSSPIWITNSKTNINYYKSFYEVDNIAFIPNGVDSQMFSRNYPTPQDLQVIKDLGFPVVGFGGKISHLVDFELINYITETKDKLSFVFIGPVLDKKVFKKIIKRRNVFFLGDKHYKIYTHYVTNFDIGIIPYVTGAKESGADSIKAYEYIAAKLPVVATNGNGMERLKDLINVAKTNEEFAILLDQFVVKESPVELHSWKQKAYQVLELINDL